MRSGFFVAVVSVLFLSMTLPVSAEMEECLTDGDFENVTEGIFSDWEYRAGSVDYITPSSDSVISDTYSAKIGSSDGTQRDIHQYVDTSSTWQFDMDFAFLEGSTRSVSFVLWCPDIGEGGPINVKVDSGSLYVVDYNAWSDPIFSIDPSYATSGSIWSGQTPVTNHITIEGFYDEDPYYTITVNGESSGNLAYFQGASPVGSTVGQVMLRSGDGGDVNYWLADNVSLLSSASSLPGDLNSDGFVGGDDLDIVRSYWGQTVEAGNLLQGDPSEDGFVGGDDLDIVRANWGQGTPPAPNAVPEPASIMLLTSSLIMLWVGKRHRR